MQRQTIVFKGLAVNSMKPNPALSGSEPHLTPASLVGQMFGRKPFNGVSIALIDFCPRPNHLDKFSPQNTTDQYFIHVPPANVQICKHDDVTFLSIAHVYGGPVSSALVEELAFYGIKYILAYGLAGGLGTKNLQMGDFYLVEQALALDGTTPHYSDDRLILSDKRLNAKILELAQKQNLQRLTPVQAMTADAIYREYDHDLQYAKENGCDIVNCDSSHLFAVSREVGIKTTQCGVISDVTEGAGEEWDSKLSVMLSANDEKGQEPLVLVGDIIDFYITNLIPELMGIE